MQRVFKAKGYARSARKARNTDAELSAAIDEAIKGQADDLGGGVIKKRLNRNEHRSIILMKGGRNWVYQYLFANQDRANIDDDELAAFKALTKAYARLGDGEINALIAANEWMEICND